MAGLVPATPLIRARPCHTIGVAGTSPAMTLNVERRSLNAQAVYSFPSSAANGPSPYTALPPTMVSSETSSPTFSTGTVM
jgi:hypothetical protein